MKPHDLLATAEALRSSANGKPSHANLCRAVSTIYYALFHCLARECADLLIGGEDSQRSEAAWRQVYRSLEHGMVKKKYESKKRIKFPEQIEEFAELFVEMQGKRHQADYNPVSNFTKHEVALDIFFAHDAIDTFKTAEIKDRRAFCAFVLLRDPRT